MPSKHINRRIFLGIAIPAFAQTSGDESTWTHYLTWLKGRNVGSLLGLEDYRETLAAEGLPRAEVNRRMSVIKPRALRSPEAMRLWFNTMMSAHGGPDWPTPLLVQAVDGLDPGDSLDVAMGQVESPGVQFRAGRPTAPGYVEGSRRAW